MNRNEMIFWLVSYSLKEQPKGESDKFVRMLAELLISSDEEVKAVFNKIQEEEK